MYTKKKPEILNYSILDFNPDFQFNLECIFTQNTLKVKDITHDLNHDSIFYCSHNPLWMPEANICV